MYVQALKNVPIQFIPVQDQRSGAGLRFFFATAFAAEMAAGTAGFDPVHASYNENELRAGVHESFESNTFQPLLWRLERKHPAYE